MAPRQDLRYSALEAVGDWRASWKTLSGKRDPPRFAAPSVHGERYPLWLRSQAAYTAYEGWQANVQAYNDTLKMVLSYECGGRQPDDSLRDTLNGTRIDLSKMVAPTSHFSWPPTTRLYKREKESYGEKGCLKFRCSEGTWKAWQQRPTQQCGLC